MVASTSDNASCALSCSKPLAAARCSSLKLGLPSSCLGHSMPSGRNAQVVHAHGIDAICSVLSRPCSIEDAIAEAAHNVRSSARNVAALLAMGQALRA